MRALLVKKIRRILICAHRRSGKDTMAFNLLWMMALQRPGLYYHLLPKISQSSSVIWRGRGKDGHTFLDYIPNSVIEKINHSAQSITLINGSLIKITGADNFTALLGTNPLGLVISEIQSTDPRAWDYLRPVLAENGGFAIFIGTPRGHNHFYEMYEQNKNNPDWYVKILSATDTTLHDGTPVITQAVIEEEIRSGMPQEIVAQEFYCSWAAAIQGAYFTHEMQKLKLRAGISTLPIDVHIPVHTSWDLGISDSTSIGFYQVMPTGAIHCIYHFEDSGKDLASYAFRVLQIQRELGFKRFGLHFVPHDIRVRELGTGRTRFEILAATGLSLRIVPNHKIIERIQCIRVLLERLSFHTAHTKHLVRSLLEYHAKFDEKRQVNLGPAHDWSSHAVDSFGYFAVGYLDAYDKPNLQLQKTYASFIP